MNTQLVRTRSAQNPQIVRVVSSQKNATANPPSNIAKIIHHELRGRYVFVIVLGVIFGAAAAVASLRLTHSVYRSEGLVRIAYSLPEVVQETDQNRPLLMFDTFMQSQKLLMTSRRLIDMAVTDPVWKSSGRQVPADPEHYFANYLKVDVSPRSEYISVSVTDPDPNTAAAAVTAVILSYAQLYNEQQATLERQRLGVLDDKAANLKTQIDELDGKLQDGERHYGTADLREFYEASVSRVTKLEAALADIRSALATLSSATTRPADAAMAGASSKTTDSASSMTVQQIALVDPTMQNYYAELTRREEELENLKLQGFGEAHKSVVAAQRALELAQKHVEDYAGMYRQYHAATSQNLGDPRLGPVLTAGKSAEVLRANEASLSELYSMSRKEMVDLGLEQNRLRRLQDTLTELRQERDQLIRRESALRSEEQMGGRLSIISTGEVALAPEKDRRTIFAAAAAGAGGCLPAGVLLLLSFLNRKYRYSEDAETAAAPHQTPLLGILPEVGENKDPDEMAGAAHSVHQLRVALSSKQRGGSSSVYLITSALSGEGKTSVTMSLGLSFAASRLRTLIIDGDLVGRKLTSILQAKELEGLHEAAAAGTLRHRVRRTDSGVYILPAGCATIRDAGSLSAPMMRSLLAEARRYFDLILIDSGPILGSVEASVFAQEADEVIFTISRGQSKQMVDRGMGRLRALGANVTGCIFNRARTEDFVSSPYGSSTRSVADVVRTSTLEERLDRYGRFGSLVQAVAVGTPAAQN